LIQNIIKYFFNYKYDEEDIFFNYHLDMDYEVVNCGLSIIKWLIVIIKWLMKSQIILSLLYVIHSNYLPP